MNYLSPLEMMYKWESQKSDEVFLNQPIDGVWYKWTYKEAMGEIRSMASYLLNLNLPNSSKIGILSKNCAHWIMSDLAIMMSGHISVPLYPNLNSDTLNKILVHSETKILFVGKLDEFSKMKSGIPDDVKCISYPYYSEDYPLWDNLIAGVSPIAENILRNQLDLATIIYTSGTTGEPKGVMHKFFNLSFSTTNAMNAIPLSNESFFSYLPLCHIAERLLVEMGAIYTGGKVSFAESLDTFSENLSNTSPTVFLGVPRIWTKFQQAILAKLSQKKLNVLLNIPIISFIIKTKIKKSLGLYKAKNIFTGAAPTPESLITWFEKLDINIQEAYAMTENTCYSHVTLRNNIKLGFVGQPLPHCEVKLSNENEILIKHEALMDGYYKDENQTSMTIKNGWLYTGDEGFIDSEGFLKITGRVKDLFKTSKGKYIAPSPIEMMILKNEYVDQVCVVGSQFPQPIALMIINRNREEVEFDEYKLKLKKTLEQVNNSLNNHEKIYKFIVIDDEWSIKNNLMTPTMKIKRNNIEKKYQSYYEQWYNSSDKIIFYKI